LGELIGIATKLALQKLDPAQEPKRKKQAKPETEMKPTTEVKAQPAKPESRRAKPAPVSRYVTAQVKREVWRRDQGKCEQCKSVHRLQIDHIQPYALGGSNELTNLRLLCFHCNQREADQKLGREWMETHRKQPLEPHTQGHPQPKQTHLPIPPVQDLAGGFPRNPRANPSK